MNSKFEDSQKKHICHLIDYGMMVLDNFSTDLDDQIDKVAGYYIMPKYAQNLEQYLVNQKEIDFATVLNIAL